MHLVSMQQFHLSLPMVESDGLVVNILDGVSPNLQTEGTQSVNIVPAPDLDVGELLSLEHELRSCHLVKCIVMLGYVRSMA